MQRLIDACFELGREVAPRCYNARTRHGWRLAGYRYQPRRGSHRTPVLLGHGMSSNRWDVDGPERTWLARHLVRKGYDNCVVKLGGAGRSTRTRLCGTGRATHGRSPVSFPPPFAAGPRAPQPSLHAPDHV